MVTHIDIVIVVSINVEISADQTAVIAADHIITNKITAIDLTLEIDKVAITTVTIIMVILTVAIITVMARTMAGNAANHPDSSGVIATVLTTVGHVVNHRDPTVMTEGAHRAPTETNRVKIAIDHTTPVTRDQIIKMVNVKVIALRDPTVNLINQVNHPIRRLMYPLLKYHRYSTICKCRKVLCIL